MNWMVGRRFRDILSLTAAAATRNINGSGTAAGETILSRYFSTSSRKRAPNLRKINPKVAPQEAASIAESLYNVVKQHGPLSVSNTWNLAKEAGVGGLNSKTHMKLMLKWMRGRNMLKQFCNHVGSNKKFLLSTLPEDPKVDRPDNSAELKIQKKRPTSKRPVTKRKKLRC